jgi:cytochrome c biogenesis factor
MTSRGTEYTLLSRETALSIGAAILGASSLVIFVGTSAPIISKKVDISYYGNLHVPIAIALMLVNGLSLALKWKQSNTTDVVRKARVSAVLSVIITGILYLLGIQDIGYVLIIAASLFSLFINLEVTYSLLQGKFGFIVDSGAELKTKVLGALRWVGVVGLLVMIFTTKGDFYQFGYFLEQYGLYWLAAALLTVFVFVVVGSVRMKADTRFLGAYVAHVGLALFILGVVASSHYEETTEFTITDTEKVKLFDDYELTYGGYKLTPPQNYNFVLNVRESDGTVTSVEPVLFFSAFDNFKTANPKPSILKYGSRDLYFTVKGTEPIGGPPKDSLLKGQTISVIGGAVDITFNEFEFTPEERQKMMSGQTFTVKANLTATIKETGETIPVVASVKRNLETEEADKEDVVIGNTDYHIQLTELRPNLENREKSMIFVETFDAANPPPPVKERVFVQAFIKPYINMVWGGVIILTVGFAFSMLRRRKEAMTAIAKAEERYERIKERRAPNDDSSEPVAAVHVIHAPTDIKKSA